MSNLFKGVIKLTEEQFNTLKEQGSLTVGDQTITYDPLGTLYLTPDNTDAELEDLKINKQDKLTAGTNITIDENNVISAEGGVVEETDPTVPTYVKEITEQDINNWNNKANLSDIPPTDSEFSLESENPIQNKVITNVVEDINRSLSEAYAEIDKIEDDLTDKPSKEEVTAEISDAISAVVDSAPEAFDTLKEIADWIQDDITGTEALVNRVTANETNIASEVTNRESADSEIRSSIPTMLAQLSGDATHQTVSEAEKSTWNDKVSPSALDSYVKKVDASLPTASIEEDYALVANEDGTIYKRAMNKLLDDIGGSTILNDGIRQDSFDVKTLQDQITENSDDIATNASNIANKVDKVTGKGLSTNDFTDAYKTKLDGIASGAEVNVQSDWNETNTASDAFIKNKPTIPTNNNQLTNGAGYIAIETTNTLIDIDLMPSYGIKFSNGLIINWGKLIGEKKTVNTVTFPIPFTSSTYSVVRTLESTSTTTGFQVRGVGISSHSTTNFTYYRADNNDITGGSYFAIGY